MQADEQEAFEEYMNEIQQTTKTKTKKKKGGQLEESPRLPKQTAAAGVVLVPRVQFTHENT